MTSKIITTIKMRKEMQTLENLLRVSRPMSGRPVGGRQNFQFLPSAFSTIPVVLYLSRQRG